MIIRAKTTTITSTERARHVVGSRRLALAVLSVAVTLGASAACARPQVSIDGDGADVRLEASNAPLSEVLSALERAFPVRYRTAVPLDQSIIGTYRGPLRHVLSRLLDGFSYYVADTAEGGMEITVIGRRVIENRPSAPPQAMTAFQKLEVPPPTVAEVAAERRRAHHRRPPQQP
jgi:hypothetical protein